MTLWEQRRWLDDFFAFFGKGSIDTILKELNTLSNKGVVYRRPKWIQHTYHAHSSIREQVAVLMASTGAQSYTAARFMLQTYRDSHR